MIHLFRFWLVLSVCLGMPLAAGAHEVDACLAKVAQASGFLQACRVVQTEAAECDALAQRLERFQAECRQLQHPPEHIARAVAAGAAEVGGQPELSPYQQRLAKENREQRLIDTNLQRFLALFPGFETAASTLMKAFFSTRACPFAYEGVQGRWLHAGHIPLQRHNLAAGGQTPPASVQFHFFAPVEPGRCYPVPPPEASGAALNIPEQVVEALERQGRAMRCESLDCTATRERVQAWHRQYQNAYQEYRQLMVCVEAAGRRGARAFKLMPRTITALPDHCPDGDIKAAYRNAEALVKALDQRLFGTGL